MKKALATTMATLLFGLSFPVNTFASPDNAEKTNHLDARKPKEFTTQDYNNRLYDRDPNFQLSPENKQNQEEQKGPFINSESANNVKPKGYFTVTFKVDESKGTLTIGGQDTSKSELIYFVKPNAGIKLKDVGIFSVKVKDSTKYKLDDSMPWNILPEKYKQDTLVTEDVTLIANIKDLTNQAPGGESNNDQQGMKIAERIKGHLKAKDISVWQKDPITWKDGVELDSSVNDPDLKEAFAKAKFEDDKRNSSSLAERKPLTGKVKVTFSDDSFIEVENQKLYVFPHVTSSNYSNLPKDAITTKFFLGEGTKVVSGNNEILGDKDHVRPYQNYEVKSGTDISKYHVTNKASILYYLPIKPLDDSYHNIYWESNESKKPNDYIVSSSNYKFTAKATKRYRVTFEFQGLDLDTSREIDKDSLSKSLKDKMPEAAWVEKGKSFKPPKADNFTEIIKDDGGQVTKVYNWTFSTWNPTGIVSASENKNFVGTWKRAQATSAEPQVEKITESDKSIKGQGEAGAKIKVTFGDKASSEATVGPDKKWEVKITKNLKKNEKISITQMEKGKKESAKKEVIVSEKAKENKKPDTNPVPKPENKPDNKPQENPDKKPLPSPEKKDKENQRGSNYFGLRFKNHTSKTTKVKTQVENKNLSNKQKEEARHIIDVMSGNYQVIKDGVRQNKQMDVKPIIKNDRLMLPLRSLAEMIGAKVEWDPQTRTAIFTNKGLVAKIQIDGNEIVLSNGKVIKMDSKPLNINGRILLPISNVANVFGLTNGNTKDGIDQNIEWDGDNKTVEINLNK